MFDIILSYNGKEYRLRKDSIPLKPSHSGRLSGKGALFYWSKHGQWKCDREGTFENLGQEIDNKCGVPLLNDYDVPSLVRCIKRRETYDRKLKREQYIISLRKSIGDFFSLNNLKQGLDKLHIF